MPNIKIYIIYIFIDYAKAFDNVQHVTLFEILQELDVNGKDVELIKNLYSNS